jgi:MFS superfamily sulfate permease-like transporter
VYDGVWYVNSIAFLLGVTWLKARYPNNRPLQVVPQFAVIVALVTALSWIFDFAQYNVDVRCLYLKLSRFCSNFRMLLLW